MLSSGRITGRIRGEDNKLLQGYAVTGYLEVRGLKVKIGSAGTDENGGFEINFSPKDYSSEDDLLTSIQVEDRNGNVAVDTPSKKNSTGRIDFQIKLSGESRITDEIDIYSGGMARLVSAYSNLDRTIDPSRSDVKKSLESLIGVVSRWNEYRDELEKSCGLEVIQVPKQPRKDEHKHVSRWDEAVLP